MKYIYGLDLSMECTGIAIFDLNGNPVYICSIPTGNIKLKKNQEYGIRLKHIADKINELLVKYPIEKAIIERGFTRFNMSTQVIYRVHGLINYLLADVEQIYYPPKTVKEAIVNGNATKEQVKNEIKKHYPNIEFTKIETKDKKTKQIKVTECEDESDAFAVALTWFIKNNVMTWEKSAKTKTKKTKNVK